MPVANHPHNRFRKGFILLLLTGVAVGFLGMIHDFLIALLLAAVVAGLLYPLYWHIRSLLRDRAMMASAVSMRMLARQASSRAQQLSPRRKIRSPRCLLSRYRRLLLKSVQRPDAATGSPRFRRPVTP